MIKRGIRRRIAILLATSAGFGSLSSLVIQAKDQAAAPVVPDAARHYAQGQSIQLGTIDVRGRPAARRPVRAPAPPAPVVQAAVLESNPGGDVGYHARSTASATKTNTPLRDIPQSVQVVTRQQIQDIGAQRIEDVVHYVPGVNWHQGEGNRDQIVIRGQSSTADFFVNGMRDDAQLYRDLYNTRRLEFLKGPNALIFGRGGGGGILNRVLKDADGVPINEWIVQTGSFNNKRVSADVGHKTTDTVYARINGVVEDTDSYRDYVHNYRYGINPTVTWLATPATRVQASYEYFRDERTADRGIPSMLGAPFAGAEPSTYYGNPALSNTASMQSIATGTVEHDFSNGLSVKSQTRYADYRRYYQNVYPGSAVNPTTGTLTLAAYRNGNDRQNVLNQTDWTYRFVVGPVKNTMVFGTEFGNQKSQNERITGFFANSTVASAPISAFAPTTFQPVFFNGLASDARNQTNLNLAAVYVQDQIELTRWLQFIGGVRFDRFDLSTINLNAQSPATLGQTFARIDDLVSPRAGVVVKPVDPLSLYGSTSVSYLPASGDQFGALTAVTTGLQPEKFTNKEVGAKWDINKWDINKWDINKWDINKWDINPLLTFTMAVFELDRENTPIRDTTGIVIAAGHSRVRGIEAGLTGYVTEQWQISAGYANLDARFVTDTSNAAGVVAAKAGNHVPFVPAHSYSLWNRYDFNTNWGAGLGVIAQDAYYANADNAVNVPGYVRVDGAVFWRLNKYVRAQVNVENIFGAKYYPSADGNNNITIGSPRAARFTLISNFTGEDHRAPMWGPGLPELFRHASAGPISGPAAMPGYGVPPAKAY